MFTQPSPASQGPANLGVSPVTATPASSSTPPARTSRLRGLSYLRNYTQTHILSREHSASSGHSPTSSTPPAASSTLPPTNPWFASIRNDNPSAVDSSSNNPSSSSRTNRLSQLVPTLPHPLGLSTSSSEGRAPAGTAAGTPSDGQSTDSAAVPFVTTSNTAFGGRDTIGPSPHTDSMTRARSATAGDAISRHDGGGGSLETLPSIRFSTFFDPRATRPSLKFAPVSRTLPTGREVIRVGRYSERDNQPNAPANAPSAAPVGFKSKVVSRRHCEFWYEDGKWFIKDVKSSSGTFLNHIRLSPPGTESKPYPVNDGDIVQLGIDFKGGEEMIFRCVKMRLELNRGWQNKLNTFNMATHKRLRNMTAGNANSASGAYSQDCSICLNSIAPCQCLFVAPCSHTWHYKCIRSLLASPSYPIFICPNCRAAADLEAEVEDPEEWEQLDSDEGPAAQEGALLQPPPSDPNNPNSTSPSAPRRSRESVRSARLLAAHQQQQQQQQQSPPPAENESPDVAMLMDPSPPDLDLPVHTFDGAGTLADASVLSHAMSNPMPIPIPSPAQRITPDGGGGRRETRTPSPTGGGGSGAPAANGHEGPITPRNDAGPWVFDGSGVRLSSESARPALSPSLAGGGQGQGVSQGGVGGDNAPGLVSLEAAVQAVGARIAREGDGS